MAAAGRLRLDHLDTLESEAIHIFREVAAEFERPVLLFTGGKDSVVMLHLAAKAFWPAPVPFPLLHVDTGPQLPRGARLPRRTVERLGARLEVAQVQDYIDDGRLRERTDGTRNPLQTQPLLDAIAEHRFDAVFGGGRRDEEKARAKERIFSLRDEFGAVGPAQPAARAVEPLQRQAPPRRARARVPAVELDRARHLALHRPRGHRAARRSTTPTSARCSSATACGSPSARGRSRASDEAVRDQAGALPHRRRHVVHRRRRVRRRDVDDVVVEVAATRLTERGATRADDRISEAAMEDRKKEGYF